MSAVTGGKEDADIDAVKCKHLTDSPQVLIAVTTQASI
jgi:hypothetical protein